MLNRLNQILSTPVTMHSYQPWKNGLYYGLAVYATLALFQPFGISRLSLIKYYYLLGYFVITMLGCVIPCYVIKLFNKDYFNEDRWTFGKNSLEYLFNILLITIGNLFYATFFGSQLTLGVFFMVLWQTLVVSVGVHGVNLWQKNKVLRQNLERAVEVNRHIHQNSESSVQETWVCIEGAGKNAVLQLDLQKLLYVESDRNYSKIVYTDACGALHEPLLRITISSLEEQVSKYEFIARCHRAFLVNTRNVKEVEGNSSGYRLSLKLTDSSIPVSRSYAPLVLNKIETD